MFDVLMYLFETYVQSELDFMVDQDALADELTRAGFQKHEIYKAITWLEELAALHDEQSIAASASAIDSFRIFAAQEIQKLSTECRGFLLFLEQVRVLTPETREIVIERLMELDAPEIELDDLKWVVMMVLFNLPGGENACQQLEELMYEPETVTIQ